MQVKIFTLPFDEEAEGFPDEIVSEFCLNKKVLRIGTLLPRIHKNLNSPARCRRFPAGMTSLMGVVPDHVLCAHRTPGSTGNGKT
ncbi:MAG: hypothetical protein ACKV1O_23495 [Saprospiraceae bacterium]